MTGVLLEKITKRFHSDKSWTEAVAGLDMEVKEGEFVTLVGPSGCGKTTTLRIVAGLEEPTSGRLLFDGSDVTGVPVQHRRLSMVFQNYAIFPHMSVARNIGYGLRLAKVPNAERMKRVREVAELVGIGILLDRYPRQLSGGQRQRVALARALAREPRLVLLDEPLSNLDAMLRDQMRGELKQLHRRLGNTMIYVTHDQLEAITLSDRLAVMREGKLQQYGTPQEIFRHPVNIFVASFIGSPTMNLFDGSLAHRDGMPHIWLSNGIRVAIDRGRAAAAPDHRVTVGVRPQDVSLAPTTDATEAWNVSVIEPLGTESMVHFERKGLSGIAMHPEPVPFGEGELVTANFPPQLLYLFDRATGKRVPTSPS